MSEARVNNLSNESNTGGPTISGITTFSGTNYFVPPVGSTAQRPDNPQKGAIRFNTDSAHLEYFRGDTIGWSEIEASHGQLGGGTGSNTGTGARALWGGGTAPAQKDIIDYVTISTLGDATDFGNLSGNRFGVAGVASRTRAVFAGGYVMNTIEYVTFSSTGNATDFGDRTATGAYPNGASSQTRGIVVGGYQAPAVINIMDYITIASTGNAVDFGNSTQENWESGGCSSSTRAIFAGGRGDAPGYNMINTIDYVEIATTGDAADFGDATVARAGMGACSSSTRGVFSGGYTPTVTNIIDYITIATLGNSVDFGDNTDARRGLGGCSSPTRGVFSGSINPSFTNVMDYVEIATTGNAVDFGDSTDTRAYGGNCSNAHGGL